MKLIKFIFQLIALIFVSFAIVYLFWETAPVIGEEEQFNPDYHLDLTLSYRFVEATTTMTAHVPVSPCNYCLKNYNPSKCLTVCDVIID